MHSSYKITVLRADCRASRDSFSITTPLASRLLNPIGAEPGCFGSMGVPMCRDVWAEGMRGSPKQLVCMLQLFDRVKSYIRFPLWVDKILHQYCFCYFHYDMHRVEPTPLPSPKHIILDQRESIECESRQEILMSVPRTYDIVLCCNIMCGGEWGRRGCEMNVV